MAPNVDELKLKQEEKEQEKGDSVEKQWRAAQLFLAKGPSAGLEYLGDETRARLFAYRAQGLDGPCPPEEDGTLVADPALKEKQEAWKSLGNMAKDEAKKIFVQLLTEALPGWTEWDAVHGKAFRTAQLEGGEAERLLKAFRDRTGVTVSSRL